MNVSGTRIPFGSTGGHGELRARAEPDWHPKLAGRFDGGRDVAHRVLGGGQRA